MKPLIGRDADQVPVNGMLGKLAFLDNFEQNASVVNRATDSIFVPGDVGKFIKYTGTLTQTFSSVAALKTDWFVYVKNAGTGFITLDPYGSETINVEGNDVTTWELWPQESGILICNGTGFDFIRYAKGVMTKNITPITSVSFAIGANGLVSRNNLLLELTNIVVTAGASKIRLTINGFAPQRTNGISTESTNVYVQDSPDTYFGACGLLAGAEGADRLFGRAHFNVDPVSGIYVSLDCHYKSGGNDCYDSLACVYVTTTTNAVSSIALTTTSGNFTSGTIRLREI